MKHLILTLLCALGSWVYAGEIRAEKADNGNTIMNVQCPVSRCRGSLRDSRERDRRGIVYECSAGHKVVIER
jgi:hypothetical protein